MQAGGDEIDQFSALVGQIYECSLDPEGWQDVLAQVSGWLGVTRSLLYTPLHTLQNGGQSISHGFSERVMADYQSHYHTQDVWTQTGVRRKLIHQGKCLIGTDLVPIPELETTSMFREFLEPNDIPHLMTAVIFDGKTDGTLPVVLSNFRGKREGSFEEDDRRKLQLLLPHLSRAMGIMFRLREADHQTAATLAALDRLHVAVLLIGSDGHIVFANRAANRILDEQDGLRLHKPPGARGMRLIAENTGVQARIDRSICQCLGKEVFGVSHFGADLTVPRPSGRPAFALRFSALPETHEFGQGIPDPRAVAFLSDASESIATPPDVLGTLFGLTPAEARLASALASGESLAATAARLNISINTAKTQLQAVYAKVGVDSRSKLVRLIVALVGQAR